MTLHTAIHAPACAWLLLCVGLAGCVPQPMDAEPTGTAVALEDEPGKTATGAGAGQSGPAAEPEAVLALTHGPLLAQVKTEPQVRIRIQTNLAEITLGRGETLIAAAPGETEHPFQGPLTITRSGAGFLLADAQGKRWTWASPHLTARARQGPLPAGKLAYPGVVELAAQGKAGMDLINDVPLEAYLPGVLAKELYPAWQPEAYRAQAIAARSYAIWEMTLRRAQGRPFDLESNESSQAYLGTTANPKAARAVAQTRGVVLAYDGRVLPAFFSACAGGAAQDAAVAFPGRVADLPPLRGHALGNAAALCPNYQWGPLRRDKADAIRRLAAWGAGEKNPVAQLRSLKSVRVSAIGTRGGRPAQFELIDDAGQVFTLGCEDFRLALNGGAPALDPKLRLLSSYCSVQVFGDQLVFENGRGHGHGVGLEQWGAEGMARQGALAEKILGTYYPGATLQRAY